MHIRTFYFLPIILFFLAACESENPGLALGTLERDRIAHTATVSEVIVSLPIEPGSRVTKGDILVQLDDRSQSAMVARAAANVAANEANLTKLRNGARAEEVAAASAKLEGARAALVEGVANYQRAKNLVDRKLDSQANLDKLLAVRDSNAAALHAEEEQLLALTNGTRPEDLLMAEAQLAATRAELASEQKKLSDLTITATRDGILDNLPWNLGERVTMGSPLAIVLAGIAPFARVYIPGPYRIKVTSGDVLIVRVDGLVDPISGTVRWISSDPAFSPYYALNQEERARLMYLAEIQLPDEFAKLPSGVPAQVELP
ncbi:MAG: biotin/lipoyl-binding protein [Pseudomonadales bacterium]|nr:biotin/lipoyl-binding protein [Pseudomonadales bacterium]